MAIWVRLIYLPFEYYQNDLLRWMGNLLGKTLKINKNVELANIC